MKNMNVAVLIGILVSIVVGGNLIPFAIVFVTVAILGGVAWLSFSGIGESSKSKEEEPDESLEKVKVIYYENKKKFIIGAVISVLLLLLWLLPHVI